MPINKHLILFSILLLARCAHTQPAADTLLYDEADHRGIKWGFSFGVGYSAHADSYYVNMFRIKEYPGFRAIMLDARLGWRFHNRLAVFGAWRLSPSNATYTPYRSSYQGGYLACYLGQHLKVSLYGGLGKYRSKISKDTTTGDGLVTNMGLAYQFNRQAFCELNVVSGALKPGNVRPNPFAGRETNVSVGVGFLF